LLVQAFIPEFAVETFNVGILLRLAWLDKAQLQLLPIGPLVQRLADKFRAIVYRYRFWQSPAFCQPLQHIDNPPPRQ
jgi:hypothetical protein